MNAEPEDSKAAKMDAEQKKVIRVYAAFVACLFLGLVPSILFATLTALLFTGVMSAAYRIRKNSAEGSLAENHMTYIIRTIWLISFLAIITLGVAAAYFLSVYDPTPVQSCFDGIMSGTAHASSATALFMPCADDFNEANGTALKIGGIISAAPVVVYFLYRLMKGVPRALQGYRVANVKSWF